MTRMLGCLGLVLLVTGCKPSLTPLTGAPPRKAATISNERGSIALSKGVSLALGCSVQGRWCRSASIEVSDPSRVLVFESALDWTRREPVFVLVGNERGSARLRVRSEEGEAEYLVTVVD